MRAIGPYGLKVSKTVSIALPKASTQERRDKTPGRASAPIIHEVFASTGHPLLWSRFIYPY